MDQVINVAIIQNEIAFLPQPTGTIRENRTANTNQKMIISKQLQKQERECFKYCSDGTVYIAKWHKNSIVTIASNWENHTAVHKI